MFLGLVGNPFQPLAIAAPGDPSASLSGCSDTVRASHGVEIPSLPTSEANVFERELKLLAITTAPVVTFFVLGIFSRRANTPGVLTGGAAGIACALALNGFQGIFEPLITGINFFWAPGLSTTVSLFVGWTASRLFPPQDPETLKPLMVRQEKTWGPSLRKSSFCSAGKLSSGCRL